MTAHTVYILECSNRSYYTGYTTNLTRRFEEHVRGTSKSKYTRSFPPVKIAAQWVFENRSLALKAEKYLKSLKRSEKTRLINNPGSFYQVNFD